MTDYQPMAAPAAGRTPTRGGRPPSIKAAVTVVWIWVALGAISFVVTLANLDDIVAQALQNAPADAPITEGAARTGVIAGAALGLVIGAVLPAVLAIFLRRGQNWARIVLTILAALTILLGLIGLATGGAATQGAVLLVLQVLTLVLAIGLLVVLWRPASSAWLHGGAGTVGSAS